MGVEELRPAPNDYLQRWPVSRRVNSAKADKDDAKLVNPILDDPNGLKDVALPAGGRWLTYVCPGCQQIGEVDLAELDYHRPERNRSFEMGRP